MDIGVLFWVWGAWVALSTTALVVCWYEMHVVAGYKRRATRLAADLETMRDNVAGRRR